MSCSVTIVMYHYVREIKNSKYPNIKGLEYSLFKEQLHYFLRHYNIVSMNDVLAFFSGEEKQLPPKAMLLTFDDGYLDHYTYVLPELKKNKIQGSFFVSAKTVNENKILDVNKIHFLLATTSVEVLKKSIFKSIDMFRREGYKIKEAKEWYVDLAFPNRWDDKDTIFIKRCLQNALPDLIRSRIIDELFHKHIGMSEEEFYKELYLSLDDIVSMKREGMYFGVHGYKHLWLGKCDLETAKKDTFDALDYFVKQGIVLKDSWVMNYPYGSYSMDFVEFISNVGCQMGLTVEPRVANLEKEHRLLLPRLDTNDFT